MLPINLLDLLELKFLLNNNLIIREETSRKNISYNKIPISSTNNPIDYIKEIIKKYIEKLEDKEKIIIFCNNKEKVRLIARELKILYYYSSNNKDKVEEKEELEENLNKFLDINNKKDFIIVTTIALSIGINYPYIKVSIYVPTIKSLVNIIQETGRIARKLEKGYSYLLYYNNIILKPLSINLDKEITTLEEFKILDKYKANKLLVTKGYLRKIINKFLDNNLFYISYINSKEKNSNCLKKEQILESSRK